MNGRIVRQLGTRAIWGVDNIKVDGQEISKPFERIYLILNKPFGFISTLNDPEGRPIVTELLKDIHQRVYPVGRLDFDTIGLLPFTNDGEWSYRLTHPRYHVPRTYKVTVKGIMDERIINLLRKGVQLEDGFSGPSKITLLKKNSQRTVIRMTITSGRSRLVRRMMEAVGYGVIQLLRTGFGCLVLGNLKVGEYRYLESHEVQAMQKMVGLG